MSEFGKSMEGGFEEKSSPEIMFPSEADENEDIQFPSEADEDEDIQFPSEADEDIEIFGDEGECNDEVSDRDSPAWYKPDENVSSRPSPRDSEVRAQEIYGGNEQVSYKNGQVVPYGTEGSTRPDLVVEREDGSVEAIEVKNYNLKEPGRVNQLTTELYRQVSERIANMPEGAEQRIVLDVRGQNLTQEEIDEIVAKIKEELKDIYPDIPVDVINDETGGDE